MGVLWRAGIASLTPPSSHQLRQSYLFKNQSEIGQKITKNNVLPVVCNDNSLFRTAVLACVLLEESQGNE
jgi:hypothetical protein